jgi:hypothetical protein
VKIKADWIFAVAVLGGSLAAQNLVSTPDQRQAVIAKMDTVLASDPVEWPLESIARLSPFSPVEAAPPAPGPSEVVIPDNRRPVFVTPPPVVRLSDQEALDSILPEFNPRGTIVMGKSRILSMPNGKLYKEGQVLPYRIKDQTYNLVIERVTIDGYTLRLGTTRVQRNFKD